MPPSLRSTVLVAGSLAGILAASAPGAASGLVRVRQHDGSTAQYPHASIVASGPHDLRIGSPDRRDALLVASSGCSSAGAMRTCSLASVRLLRAGHVYPLTLRTGSEVFNAAATSRPEAGAAGSVPGHGVVVHAVTARGTTIDVRGTIDGGAHA